MIGNGSRLSNDRAGPEISHKSPDLCLFHGGKAWRMPEGRKKGVANTVCCISLTAPIHGPYDAAIRINRT